MSAAHTITIKSPVSQVPKSIILDDSVNTVDELIKRRASEANGSPLIGYPREGLVDFEEHTPHAVDRYVDAAVARLQDLGLHSVDASLDKAPVVAILTQSSFNVIITLLGLSRLGYAVLFLSTRLSSPGLIRLLQLADCTTVVTTDFFHATLARVRKEAQITLLPLLSRDDYHGIDAPTFHRIYDPRKESQKIAFIIHSSGSTGLPKPIFLSHGSCIATFATNLGMRALLTSPLFHSHGLYETFRSIYSRKTIYLCNFALPLTKQNLISMIQHVRPELFHCVPYVLKLLAECDEGVRCLSQVKLVLFGGSNCPDDLGDRLVKNGVNLVGNYGATETGRLMNSVRSPGDNAWNYLRILPHARPYVLMDEISPGIHECVALDGLKSKSTINSQDPPNSFRTRDLFAPHPTKPNHWKYLSRLDDRLTLINGEKVLPIPIEGRIRQNEHVKEAAVFGAGRVVPGALIIRADKSSHLSDREFLHIVWPAVEAANGRAESFSRIPEELVVILPSDTSYPRTDKGTFIRAQLYRQFEQEIETAYRNFDHKEGGTLVLETPELESYILRKFREDLGTDLESSQADFYASGIDSLQCIQMWNTIKQELYLGGRQSQLSQNVLYETGNAAALARYLIGLREGNEDDARDEHQMMKNLIAKYSSFERHVPGGAPKPEKEVALVTGATGALGIHLLAQLVACPSVSAVWAPVRAKTDSAALQRVTDSLEKRGLQLSQDEQSKIIALPSDFSRHDFGLSPPTLSALKSTLTLVIHSAWAVNFKIPVQSFEDQHIKAVYNLIQLCLSASTPDPARFFFCSSVSSAGGTPRPGVVPEEPVADIRHVQGTGYARSKYVSEHIVHNSMRTAGAPARVLRVGQLIGDSKVGEWNTTEGIPLMIQTAVTLGALPALDEEMTWLPVDHAASVVLELTGVSHRCSDSHSVISERTSDPDLVYHVLNPTRFHWTRDMLPALANAGLIFQTLSQKEWLEKLRTSDQDPARNPPIKLFDWFDSKYGRENTSVSKGGLEYLTDVTRHDSETLRNTFDVTKPEFVKRLLERLAKRWIDGA